MTTVRVSVRVRKYLWSEFVHDVCFVLYATLVISNALSKRYFKPSLTQLVRGFITSIKWGFWISVIGAWGYLLVTGWLG